MEDCGVSVVLSVQDEISLAAMGYWGGEPMRRVVKPSEPLRMFRACEPDRVGSIYWTASPWEALIYACQKTEPVMATAVVPPEAVVTGAA